MFDAVHAMVPSVLILPAEVLYKFAVASPKLMPVVEAVPGARRTAPPSNVLVTAPIVTWLFPSMEKMGEVLAIVSIAPPENAVVVAIMTLPELLMPKIGALVAMVRRPLVMAVFVPTKR